MQPHDGIRFDMYDRDLYRDPYPTYRRLRDECPLYYNEQYRFYAVSRFADCSRTLIERERFISGKGGVYNIAAADVPMPDGLFIFEDAPRHGIHRALVARLFTPKAIAQLEPQIESLFDDAAKRLAGKSSFDFIADFANMLPIQVIGMLFGLPPKDYAALRATFHRTQNADTADPDHEAFGGIAAVAGWFNEYLDHRQAHPTDDMMSQLLFLEFEDETGTVRRLRRQELLTLLTLITSAGSDTTVNAIGWTAKLLSEHPDQRQLLIDRPELAAQAVDEVIRYEPISYHICRTTSQDVEFHGQTVPAGSIVVTLPGAGNRDERQFPDPDRFDITRKPIQPLTFSLGPHYCLGVSLAKMETKAALEAALTYFPTWTVDSERSVMTSGIDTRGWDSLPVSV